MPAVLPARAYSEITAPRSADTEIGLITIYPVDGGEAVRICTDPVERLSVDPLAYGLYSRGEVYRYFQVGLVKPDSSRERVPQAGLSFDNVDYDLIRVVRSSIHRARCDLEIVLAGDLDDPIKRWPDMLVTDATATIDTVTLTVGYDSFVGEPLHKYRLTRNVAPSLRPNS